VLVFSFTRGGIPNPAGLPKNSLQRIDYFFSQSTLKKQTWLSMDRNNSADYKEEIIANNLKQFRVEVLGFNGQWYPQWPINKTDAPDSLPKAVRFSFATQESGDIGRIIELPL
jgi:type II secretion system protein J